MRGKKLAGDAWRVAAELETWARLGPAAAVTRLIVVIPAVLARRLTSQPTGVRGVRSSTGAPCQP